MSGCKSRTKIVSLLLGNSASGQQRSPGDVGRRATDRSYVTQRDGVPAGRSLPDGSESPGLHGQVGRQGVHLLQGELVTYSKHMLIPTQLLFMAGLALMY